MRHLLSIGAATHVKKVCRHATSVFDDVHGRHRQPRAVDHAANVPVELDVIEVVFRGFDFERIFLVNVAQFANVWMPKQRIVIEIDLGIEREQPPIRGSDERINLQKRSVRILECLVEPCHELHGLVDLLRLEPKLKRQLARLKGLQSHAGIDVFLQYGLRILCGNLLDFHTACGRRHEDWLAFFAVDKDSNV